MQNNDERMKWILFWVFLTLFVIACAGTFGIVFFGFGTPTESERDLLVKVLIGETACCMMALFYSIFGLKSESSKKSSAPELDKVYLEIESLKKLIKNTKTNEENSSIKTANVSSRDRGLTFAYSAEVLKNFTKPPPFDESIFHLVPSIQDIRKDIENVKPYDKNHRISTYIGTKVQWKGVLTSVSLDESKKIFNIHLEAGDSANHQILLKAELNNHEWLKLIDHGTPLWVSGVIKEVDPLFIKLRDGQLLR